MFTQLQLQYMITMSLAKIKANKQNTWQPETGYCTDSKPKKAIVFKNKPNTWGEGKNISDQPSLIKM